MTSLRLLSTSAALGLLALVGWVPVSAQAASASRTAQTGYYCDISQDGAKSAIVSDTMTLGMTLDVPTSVTPGQRVALRGTLSLAFPEEFSQDAKGFVSTADGYSDSISLQLGMAGKTQVFRADRWQTPEIPVGDPIVVHAPIAFPTFTVPANASGSVVLTMPTNNVIKNPSFPTPATIAFAAAAAASGPLGTFHFNLSCYLTSGSPSVLARIPVSAPRVATPAASAKGTSGGKAKAPTAVAAAPASGATTTGGAANVPPAGAASAGTQPHAAGAPAGAAPAAQVAATPADLTPTAATERDGVYIPTGALVGIGALICLAAIAYAAWAHYRLRMLQRFLDS